jgi:hypothetical protein
MRFILSLVVLTLVALPVSAQQKYSSWSNPDTQSSTGNETLGELLDKLNALIDEAEKSRAADPVFLRDLRDLTRSYDMVASVPVLVDDFADGDFAANPVWTVSAGRYWIEKDWGLRSAITQQAESAPQQETKKTDGKDVALAILGAVLKRATKNSSNTASSAPAQAQLAAIHSTVAIANAFAIEFELSSWQPKGRFDIGPYQGTDTNSGYRLSYTPGGGLALIRNSSRGSTIIQSATNPVALEDQKSHVVLWSRDTNGQMSVSIDGKAVLNAADQGFSDPFQGVTIANQGGDYIVKRIAISSANQKR